MCELHKKGFVLPLLDNEECYVQHLIGVVESIDELAIIQMTKTPLSIEFRLSSSLPKYNPLLIEEILKLHNVFNIRLDLSKSIKSSGVISYKIIL